MTREEAVSFIRDTLGCRCPDDALWALSRETRDNPDICWVLVRETQPALEARSRVMLAAGGRLLVIVCAGVAGKEIEEALAGAAAVRDALGFQRVRLAVQTAPDRQRQEKPFIPTPDERAHLHLLHRN